MYTGTNMTIQSTYTHKERTIKIAKDSSIRSDSTYMYYTPLLHVYRAVTKFNTLTGLGTCITQNYHNVHVQKQAA